MIWGKLEYLVCWKGYGIEEDKWRLAEDVQGSKQLISEFHCMNPEAPQHTSTLDFNNLPFCLITNLTDTPDTVPSDWATGCHTLGHHTFEGGVNVRVCPLWYPHCPSESTLTEPNLPSEVTSSGQSHHPCFYHLTDPISWSSLNYIISSYPTGEVQPVQLNSCNMHSSTPQFDVWGSLSRMGFLTQLSANRSGSIRKRHHEWLSKKGSQRGLLWKRKGLNRCVSNRGN